MKSSLEKIGNEHTTTQMVKEILADDNSKLTLEEIKYILSDLSASAQMEADAEESLSHSCGGDFGFTMLHISYRNMCLCSKGAYEIAAKLLDHLIEENK